MIKRIFLDLDDVLNTLVPSALKNNGIWLCGNYASYPVHHGWDIVGAANELVKHTELYKTTGIQFDRETFWGALGRKFWASIPKTPICDWLLARASHLVGRENVFVLTRTLHSESLAGKHDWVTRNLPEWIHDQMITCARKEVCARSDALLIDDNQDNIQAFLRAGGDAIMFPRPWNDLHYVKDAKGFISTELRAIFPSCNDTTRNTGRTARMLELAHTIISRGRSVMIVGKNYGHVLDLRNKYVKEYGEDHEGKGLVNFTCAADPCIDLDEMRCLGLRATLLVDHSVKEV